ncbi:methyltransferase domain-containing protein [Jatrophihabitans sp.]|uniref:methyltransferase domain-containing protein n=1 Tax=Jatrophihabitans sp. TaxID=1932789 RepID=UPI002C60DF98|nr:class I SAM-dependent methyltransferase [Jatrophihabitans sp.]
MTDSILRSGVPALLDAFTGAPPERQVAEFLRLTEAVWHDGTVTDAAAAAVADLRAALDQAPAEQQGYLLVLLGLLVEAEYPETGGVIYTAVRDGMERYLDLARGLTGDEPLTFAALYLLGHFPADRDRILAAVKGIRLAPDDRTRLDRCLQELNYDDPDIGRSWPSPWDWGITEQEREYDRKWIAALSREQITRTWEWDTRSVWAYMGAKAYWAVQHGMPTDAVEDVSPEEVTAGSAQELPPSAYSQHLDALRCPQCGGRFEAAANRLSCQNCGAEYSVSRGVLDLSQRTRPGTSLSETPEDVKKDVLQAAAAISGIGFHYENGMRPSFLRVMGMNWNGAVAPADEDAYLATHSGSPAGTLLDVGAGAGRWTSVLAEAVGPEHVLALDLSEAVLLDLRTRLPQVPAVRASAVELPFADASLDGINCWNALQALPDAEQALREIGRCLRPGGLLTMMTFVWAPDPVYRHFQHSHHFPARPDGFPLFELADVRAWLDRAGLAVRHEDTSGTFFFVTAERRA